MNYKLWATVADAPALPSSLLFLLPHPSIELILFPYEGKGSMKDAAMNSESTPRIIYADHNATTRVADEAREAMLPFLGEKYGNPSSMHRLGGEVKTHVDGARANVAELLGADPAEIIFTSGGTESDNLAILGTLAAWPKKRRIITSAVEHSAVRNTLSWLEKKGYEVKWLTVDAMGRLDLGELREALTPETALVSLMWANNETGVIFPVEEAARIAKQSGAAMHVDAVQAAGKIPIRLRDSAIDLLTISAHKIHGPKGVGALYARRGTRLRPILLGGAQERGRRGGTENVPGIIGLGEAARLAGERLEADSARERALRDRLEEGLLARCPDSRRNGDPQARLPNTSNLSFRFIQGEAALLLLDREGICVSTGSACMAGSTEPSHVLRAMGVPFTFLQGSLRFSLGRENTPDDIDTMLRIVPRVVEELRALSPLAPENTGDSPPA